MHNTTQRWILAPILAVMVTGLLAGCGGGGGGGSSSGTVTTGGSTQATTATVTGVLQDQATGILLSGRTVTVQGTSLSGVSDSNGSFSIANVPIGSITLVIVDSAGAADGTFSVNLNSISGSPRNVGTIKLSVSMSAPPPPPIG